MKRVFLLHALLAAYHFCGAQINRADRLYEYHPAPGQFINNPLIGTPQAAETMISTPNNLISLGSFGGHVIVGFRNPVRNDPANPFGVDFSIFGNAFKGSSEPGIVWVMKDENSNGLPDDTWYQIAGSSHFHPSTRSDYAVTWYRMPDGSARWKDADGKSGRLVRNEFHGQHYYPDKQYFYNYEPDSFRVAGTLLDHPAGMIDGQIVLPSLSFGYADNRPVNRNVSPDVPDNPYTPDVTEGAGGDPVDISWAVDASGNYIDLDEIHFVKIVTGALTDLGALGEISTEVGAVVATTPSGTSGNDRLTVIHPHASAILVSDTLALYADFFLRGRRAEEVLVYESSDTTIAAADRQGNIIGKRGGTVTLNVFPQNHPGTSSCTNLIVRKPDSVAVRGWLPAVTAGETFLFTPVLLDGEGHEINGMQWKTESSEPGVIHQNTQTGDYWFQAWIPGSYTVIVYPARFPELKQHLGIRVLQGTDGIQVFATAKTKDSSLFPARWIDVPYTRTIPVEDGANPRYRETGFISLAHVVTAIAANAGLQLTFRDDEASGHHLYLYAVEDRGLFTYGWGGKTIPAPFSRGWIIRHNNHHYISGFDEIRAMTGDTIILYHVDNILNKWILTGFYSSVDKAVKDDRVDLFRWKMECSRSGSGEIVFSEISPFGNQPVYTGQNPAPVAITGENGTASVWLDESPPLVLRSGNDAVYIAPNGITRLSAHPERPFKIFPNPAEDFLIISGMRRGGTWRIMDLNGRTWKGEKSTDRETFISINDLNKGIYIIEYKYIKESMIHKFLKK